MTLNEAIKHEEEIAIQQIEKANALDNIPLFGMSKDDIEEIKECYKCSKEHEQLAEWLKELKAHREAWRKAKRTVKAYLMLEEFGSEYQDDIEKLIDGCIPKEGDAE